MPVRTSTASRAPTPPEDVAAVRLRSEGQLERLEASTALYAAFTQRLRGRSTRTPDADLALVETQAREAELVLQRLQEREPSALLDGALVAWNAARKALAEAAAERLDGLHLPHPEGFAQLVGNACTTLDLEFDRPVSDWGSMLVSVSPPLVAVVLGIWELGRFADASWRWFPQAELIALAFALAWYARARWRRARHAQKRVRLTTFGVHAHDTFFPFADIAAAWLGPGGAVMLETKQRQRLRLETWHSVELQQALQHHGVELVRRPR